MRVIDIYYVFIVAFSNEDILVASEVDTGSKKLIKHINFLTKLTSGQYPAITCRGPDTD